MYIIYISTKGSVRTEMGREQGNIYRTGCENAQSIARAHAANYRSNVTIEVTTREYGEPEAKMQGTKGW